MTSLSHTPEFPVPNRATVVTFQLTESTSNFVRVWCSIAPTGSALDKKLNSEIDPRNRVQVHEGSNGSSWTNTFDKGGKYTFLVQEYLKGSGYGGGYEGDPNSAASEEKVGSEATLTIYIGQRTTQVIGPAGNQATIVLWIWNDNIRATTKAFHGEDSPAIVAQSPTPIVKTAIESSSVVAALEGLVDAQVSAVNTVGDMTTWTHSYWIAFNAHLHASGVHDTDDEENILRDTYDPTPDQSSFQEFVSQALKLLRQHVTNDTGGATDDGVSGPDTGEYHMDGSTHLSDRAKIPLYSSVSTFAEAFGALVDLYRCFDAHQRNDDVHDSTNIHVLHSITLLMNVHKQFLLVLASAAPAAPAAQSDGVQTLMSQAGFKEG